jgi:tetratricopeptide (TPR) repeat protein
VLFILFGAPTAQEHKELLAARFARKLLHEKDRFSFLRNLRCGIATGHAYCGNLGSPKRKGYSAIGDVVNLASRLMTHVKDSGLYFDANTEKKLRPYFTTTLIENARLKGVGRPVPIYEIASEIRHHRGLLVEEKSDIVGRKDELRVLREIAQKSIEGAGQVCIVSGEAGIGKSRLAGKLISEAQGFGIEAHYGICYSYEMFTPFYPWKELLYQFFQILESDSKQSQAQKLRRGLEGLDEAGPEWIPVIGSVMGLSIEEDALTRGLDARRKNQKVFSIIFQLLEKMSKTNPILLVFEDLHWADEISIHLIEHIAARCQSMKVVILATMRPGEPLTRIHVLPHVHRLELVHLNAEDTREFLRIRLGLDPPNTALEDLVLAKVQGNPFFIESIVHGLRERGYLSLSSDGRVTLTKSLQEITIPDSIQDVVLSRIDHLNETEKAVLKVASVIGRIFTLEAVYILLRQTINHHELNEAISTLNGLGLTILELEEPLTIIFKHIVIRDVAYNTLLVSAREDLHRRVASYLEEKSADTPLKAPGILAYHFLAGNDQAKGLEYTFLAAQRAKEQYANKDAIHHYTRAVEILSSATFLQPAALADRTRRAKQELGQTLLQAGNYDEAIKLFEECLAFESTDIERADTYVGLGRVYQEKGESRRAIQELETSLRLLGRRAPRSMLGLAPGIFVHLIIHAVYTLFPWTVRPISERKASGYLKQLHTLFSLVRIYYFVDISKLTWAAMVALNMAKRSRSDYFMSLGLSYYGTLLFGAGLLKRSELHCARSAEYGKSSRDAVAEGIGLSRLGSNATFQNDLEKALKCLGQAVSIFKQVGEMWEMQTSLMLQATTHFLNSEFETAEGIYIEMGALGRELNALMHQAWSHAWAPFCRYLLGTADAPAVKWELEQGLRISIEINDLANQCAALNHMANVAVREQQAEEAAQLAVRSFESIWRYHVLVPFLQIGLVDAAEAALFALEQGASSVPRSKLLRIARLGSMKARLIGKVYPYLRGPALRVHARRIQLVKGPEAAEPIFMSAIACLEQSPNRWETGVAYLDAAAALPHRRAEFLERARDIFTKIGAQAELRRIERIGTADTGAPVLDRLNPAPSARAR